MDVSDILAPHRCQQVVRSLSFVVVLGGALIDPPFMAGTSIICPQELPRRGLSRRIEVHGVPPNTLRMLRIVRKLYGDYEYTSLALQRTKCMHFLQKYLRMKLVIVFKLSNDVLQVRARPHTLSNSSTAAKRARQQFAFYEDHTLDPGPRYRPHRQELRARALDAKPSDRIRAPPAVV